MKFNIKTESNNKSWYRLLNVLAIVLPIIFLAMNLFFCDFYTWAGKTTYECNAFFGLKSWAEIFSPILLGVLVKIVQRLAVYIVESE
jgi:hypothetical protein